MLYLLLLVLIIAAILGPQIWANFVLNHHKQERRDFPGTGGELARHLIKRLELHDIAVEQTDGGDHYDPIAKCVRLSEEYFDGKSLSAVVVAAHEVGHAIQDHCNYPPLRLRTRLVTMAAAAERIGSLLLIAMPFIGALTRVPAIGLVMFLAGLAALGIPIIVHLVTLPVEFNASFKRALPLLQAGYIEPKDIPGARTILTACAFTYVAGSLATLVNFWRWIRIVRG